MPPQDDNVVPAPRVKMANQSLGPEPKTVASGVPHCPACRTPLPGDAPLGLCPRCLMGASLRPPTLSAASLSSPGKGSFIGDYELLDEGRAGGMGVVYRARQSRLKRIVALKMIRF